MSKKDAYYFSHDSNARHDPKIIKLRTKHGLEGYGFYFCLLEIMRESADYSIDIEDLETVSYQLNISHEKAEEMIKTCIKIKLLKQDQNKLISESFISRMHEVDEMRKRQSENGKKGGKPKATNNPNESQPKATNNPNESIKVKQSKLNKLKQSKALLHDKSCDNDACLPALSSADVATAPAGGFDVECWEFFKDKIKHYAKTENINIDKLSDKFEKKIENGLLESKNPKGLLTTIAKKEWQNFI